MSGSAGPPVEPTPTDALALLARLDQIDLERYSIVGSYLRFDERTRGSLKDLRQKITDAFHSQSVDPRNFLIWGAPGSGKTYLVQQIAEPLRARVLYRELNLAQLDEREFHAGLEALNALGQPVLCLIDEVDSKPNASWPYELLLPYLEPPVPRSHQLCFCLAGSGGRSLDEMKQRIRARPKGADLLTRIPHGNEFVVPSLGVGDKVLVSAVQLLMSAGQEGHAVREVEKLALYYVAMNPAFASARQLRALASQTAQRIPSGEDRIKYDHLFHPGDPENKGFWLRTEAVREQLAGHFLPVVLGRSLAPASASRSPPPTPSAAAEPPLEPTRIVVLPFANYSPDPDDEFFADGMTEELIEKLAHVSGLRVIARTTAMHYKKTQETARSIGKALRVGTVVECSVRKAGNRMRVTAQLIDATSEEHLWSSRYDRELDDIFAIQDDISGQITRAISARLSSKGRGWTPPVVRPPRETHDIQAYTHFLHGLKLLGEKSSEATVREAVAQFESAVRRDPGFARARVGIAEATLWLGTEGVLPTSEAEARTRAEIDTALAQDDSLAEAHSVRASLFVGEDRMAEAEREARRALELNPSLSDPYRWLAQLSAGEGRVDEAVRWLETARDLNPIDVNVLALLGRLYVYAGRDHDALEHWKRTETLAPFRSRAHQAEYYLGLGDLDRVEVLVREMEQLRPESLWVEMYRGFLAGRRGDVAGARRSLARLEGRSDGLSVFLAGFVHFALGEQDAFLAAMEEAMRRHSLPLLELLYSPMFAKAREDPRLTDILRRQREMARGDEPAR